MSKEASINGNGISYEVIVDGCVGVSTASSRLLLLLSVAEAGLANSAEEAPNALPFRILISVNN